MKAKRLLAVLERAPLNYRVSRQSGSHRRLEAPGRPAADLCLPWQGNRPARPGPQGSHQGHWTCRRRGSEATL